jgi:hypothetical protein
MLAPVPYLAVVLYMAKHQSDRTTLDLFADEKRPGRPKTNPHPRDLQLKINKRNQLKRDKEKGLHRVELKLEAELLDDLNQLADARSVSRSELIQELVREYVSAQRSTQLK